eukprot:jgi/Mesen1/4145/ME000218S03259
MPDQGLEEMETQLGEHACSSSGSANQGLQEVHGQLEQYSMNEGLEDKVEEELMEVPVNLAVLASQSTFFLKMFTAQLKESFHRGHVKLEISGHETAAFLELLSFIYKGQLSESTTSSTAASVQLLLMADKYDVTTCVDVLTKNLARAAPDMSQNETAFTVEHLAPIAENYEVVKALMLTLQKRLVKFVGDVLARGEPSRYRREFFTLPKEALLLVLRSNELRVDEEDRLFDAILGWVRHNRSAIEERKMLMEELIFLVHVPYVSSMLIRDVLWPAEECQTERIRSLVFDSLLMKIGCPPNNLLEKKWLWPREKQAGETFTTELSLEECRAWTQMHFEPWQQLRRNAPGNTGLASLLLPSYGQRVHRTSVRV